MKALSIRQPYAEMIISGKKKMEYRNWNTEFRGDFLVHAPTTIYKDLVNLYSLELAKLPIAAIIGKVTLFDVKQVQVSHYKYRYGYVLRNPRRFKKPIPFVGKLHFFEVPVAKLHRKSADS